MFSGLSVCQSVCLSAGLLKNSERILMKFVGGSGNRRTKWLDFGGDTHPRLEYGNFLKGYCVCVCFHCIHNVVYRWLVHVGQFLFRDKLSHVTTHICKGAVANCIKSVLFAGWQHNSTEVCSVLALSIGLVFLILLRKTPFYVMS